MCSIRRKIFALLRLLSNTILNDNKTSFAAITSSFHYTHCDTLSLCRSAVLNQGKYQSRMLFLDYHSLLTNKACLIVTIKVSQKSYENSTQSGETGIGIKYNMETLRLYSRKRLERILKLNLRSFFDILMLAVNI